LFTTGYYPQWGGGVFLNPNPVGLSHRFSVISGFLHSLRLIRKKHMFSISVRLTAVNNSNNKIKEFLAKELEATTEYKPKHGKLIIIMDPACWILHAEFFSKFLRNRILQDKCHKIPHPAKSRILNLTDPARDCGIF